MSQTLESKCSKCGETLEIADVKIRQVFGTPVTFMFHPCEKCIAEAKQAGIDSVLICECGTVIDTNLPQCVNTKMCETCLDNAQ